MTTNIVKINPENLPIFENDIKNAAEIIKRGGLVAFPTETVYGLGGDGTNPDAARKIYEAKGRPSDNPLIIHISCAEEAEKYTFTSEVYYKIAQRFMPGPITVVLPAKDSVPMATRGGLSTVAVRCPSNPIARRLIELAGCPIAAPSANLSGSPSPTSASHVVDDMSGRIDMIIDGGDCDIGLESTIVKIESDGSLVLLRPGRITIDELACIAPVVIADAVTEKIKEGEVAISPGMKYRHYAPSSPVVLIDGEISDFVDYVNRRDKNRVAILCYRDDDDRLACELPFADRYIIGARDNINEQARHLFAVLREVDKHNYDIIYAPMPSKDGMGLALYNRMIRAAAHTIIDLRGESNG